MSEYQTLTPQQIERLRFERVQSLEADHARTVLQLAEEPDSAELHAQLTELERRIAVHASPLTDASAKKDKKDQAA